MMAAQAVGVWLTALASARPEPSPLEYSCAAGRGVL